MSVKGQNFHFLSLGNRMMSSFLADQKAHSEGVQADVKQIA